ncbi:MAG: GntR family transcriptional regulator [Egibacteraceae bacterium]
MSIDPRADRPVYQQIADVLRDAIVKGELTAGQKLPSERDLIERYGAARETVRRAIRVLMSEGRVESQRGVGVFVRQPGPPIRRMSMDRFAHRHRDTGKAAFAAEAEREGKPWRAEILELGEVEAPADIALRLQLGEDPRAFVRRRRMWIEDYPMSLADSYFPLDIAEGTAIMREDSGPGGVHSRIEEQGILLTRFEEELQARMPTPDEAHSLHLAPGVPVLDLVRTAYAGDRAVEILVSVAAGDKHVFHYAFPAE